MLSRRLPLALALLACQEVRSRVDQPAKHFFFEANGPLLKNAPNFLAIRSFMRAF